MEEKPRFNLFGAFFFVAVVMAVLLFCMRIVNR